MIITLGNTDFWMNYTYLDAWDITNNHPLIPAYRTAPPKHMLKTGATVKGKNGWTYDFEVYIWGERKTDADISPIGPIGYWFNGTDPTPIKVPVPSSLPSATICNVKVTKSLPNGRTLTLAVQNLFDKYWEEMVFYPREGRWIMLSFSQKF